MSTEYAIKVAEWLLEAARMTGVTDPEDYGFTSSVKRAGLTLLGEGHFSLVFAHPELEDKCIKLVVRAGDSAPCYLAWARANPGPYIPRVHYLVRRNGYCVAVLDKLISLHSDREKKKDFDRIFHYTNPDKEAAVYQVYQRITKFFEGVSRADLHSDNMMLDDNGGFIITDPVSFSDTKESRYMRTGIERAYGLA